ncbi:alpha/beta hydrolase [Oenococcus alcoholitolerans]|uniref:alpha/beta hydrolase n=1 Tax=Oenococcus alcoholitolerans TaxID=931074 RepID=UPI003F7051A3
MTIFLSIILLLILLSIWFAFYSHRAVDRQGDKMEFTVKTQWVDYDSIRLYGKIYVPQTEGKHPAAIIAHGFTGDHSQMAMYARSLAEKGFVAYVFDFPGGGYNVASTGRDSEHVSIASEQSDLEAALNYIRNRDDVDTDRVYLAGASLGGVVAALTAAAHPDQVRALALLYPAFNIEDDAEEHFTSADQVPAGGVDLFGMTIGRPYYQALLGQDIYKRAARYHGPVLIMHGDRDALVSMSYIERLQKTYDHARLEVIAGGTHEFPGRAGRISVEMIDQFFGDEK